PGRFHVWAITGAFITAPTTATARSHLCFRLCLRLDCRDLDRVDIHQLATGRGHRLIANPSSRFVFVNHAVGEELDDVILSLDLGVNFNLVEYPASIVDIIERIEPTF